MPGGLPGGVELQLTVAERTDSSWLSHASVTLLVNVSPSTVSRA